MKKRVMRLYVWKDVLSDYTSGMMFAVASSVGVARKELRKQCDYLPEADLQKEPEVYSLAKTRVGFCWGGG